MKKGVDEEGTEEKRNRTGLGGVVHGDTLKVLAHGHQLRTRSQGQSNLVKPGNEKTRMENGEWRMENGEWRMAGRAAGQKRESWRLEKPENSVFHSVLGKKPDDRSVFLFCKSLIARGRPVSLG